MKLKKISSYDPLRQTLVETDDGRLYSIVNLVIPPKEANGNRAGGKFMDMMYENYFPRIYELAEITKPPVRVMERFRTEREALTYLRSNA